MRLPTISIIDRESDTASRRQRRYIIQSETVLHLLVESTHRVLFSVDNAAKEGYRTTSFARKSIEDGTDSPNASAVRRFIAK